MKGYKGFNKDFTCKEKQYKVGETYIEGGDIKLCSRGMHFCTDPREILIYYPPGISRYALVEAEGVSDETEERSSKRVCSKLTIVEELSIEELVEEIINNYPNDFLDRINERRIDQHKKWKELIIEDCEDAEDISFTNLTTYGKHNINIDSNNIIDCDGENNISADNHNFIMSGSYNNIKTEAHNVIKAGRECIIDAYSDNLIGAKEGSIINASSNNIIRVDYTSIIKDTSIIKVGSYNLIDASCESIIDASSYCSISTGEDSIVKTNGENIVIAEDRSVILGSHHEDITAGFKSVCVVDNFSNVKLGVAGVAVLKNDSTAEIGVGSIAICESTGKAKGKLGSLLVFIERDPENYSITNQKSVIVDGETIKEDTYYQLKNSEITEYKE